MATVMQPFIWWFHHLTPEILERCNEKFFLIICWYYIRMAVINSSLFTSNIPQEPNQSNSYWHSSNTSIKLYCNPLSTRCQTRIPWSRDANELDKILFEMDRRASKADDDWSKPRSDPPTGQLFLTQTLPT